MVARSAADLNVLVAGACKALAEHLHGGFRMIAVRAEVTEQDLMEAGMGEIMKQVRDLVVRKVAVAGADPLLGGPWALEVGLKQGFIVIRLDKQGVDPGQRVSHGSGDMTGIRDDADAARLRAQHETDRIDRIVLDLEGGDLQGFDGEGLAAIKQSP